MRKIILIIAAVIVGSAAVFFYFGQPTAPQQYIKVQQQKVVNSLRAMGTIIPAQTVEIKTNQAETIDQVKVKEGDIVTKGEILFYYDREVIRQQLKQTKAEVKGSEVALEQAQKTVEEAKAARELLKIQKQNTVHSSLAPLKAELSQVRLKIKQTKQKIERLQRLYEKGAVGELEVENQQDQLQILQAQKNLLQARLEQAEQEQENKIEELEAKIKQADSQVQKAEKRYQQAEKNLTAAQAAYQQVKAEFNRYLVRAPQTGVVLEKNIESGEYVQPGQLAVTIGSERLLVRISPDQKELRLLEIGKQGYASPEAYPEQKFRVRVVRQAPQVDSQRGTIDIYLEFIEASGQLLPNMAASVEIKSKEQDLGLFLPPEYIIVNDNQAYVYLYRSGQAEKQQIEIQNRRLEKWQITGIKPGSKVLMPDGIQNGQQVEIAR